VENSMGIKAKAFEGRNLVYFFLIAFGWTWLWWWVLFLSGWVNVPADIGSPQGDAGSLGPLLILLVALSPFGPTIGAFVLTGINEGKAGVKALWRRFWNLKISWVWLIVVLLWWPMLRLITNLVGQLVTGQSHPLLVHPDQVWIFIPPLIISTFVNGGMSEEFGWRGYALPRLQVKFNALTASVILGLIEGLWHYPLMVIGSWWQDSVILLLFWFVVTDIFRTWIYNNVNGNLLAAMLFHGMGNVQSDIIYCCPRLNNIYWVFGIAALLVVVIFGPKDLIRRSKGVVELTDETP
jgi:membrane protease YdiL (CAAX protease family)